MIGQVYHYYYFQFPARGVASGKTKAQLPGLTRTSSAVIQWNCFNVSFPGILVVKHANDQRKMVLKWKCCSGIHLFQRQFQKEVWETRLHDVLSGQDLPQIYTVDDDICSEDS